MNRRCIGKLEEWECDGLQLWEKMNWVWSPDSVHMSNIGKVWVAWNVIEWALHLEGSIQE